MGYRNYIGSLSKEEYNNIKNLDLSNLYYHINKKEMEICNDDGEDEYVDIRELIHELYCFGKFPQIYDFDGISIDKYLTQPLFTNIKTQVYISKNQEEEYWVVNKSFMEYVIDIYRTHIKKTYSEYYHIASDFEASYNNKKMGEYNFDKLIPVLEHIQSIYREWNYNKFDYKDNTKVTSSWRYEYTIFELINIYQHFDWDKNIMIYYGW